MFSWHFRNDRIKEQEIHNFFSMGKDNRDYPENQEDTAMTLGEFIWDRLRYLAVLGIFAAAATVFLLATGTQWGILVILLLFGGKKIPELMRGLGKGVHSFKKGMQEAKEEMERPLDDEPAHKETPRGKDKD